MERTKVSKLRNCSKGASNPGLSRLRVSRSTPELRPCPHDTFPNRLRSITNGSRPVARVNTGEIGTLVPVSRDHLTIRNERARTVRDRSTFSCGRSTCSPNQQLLSHASLTYFFRDMCNCHTGHPRIWHPQIEIPICRCILPQIIGSWKIPKTYVVLRSWKQTSPEKCPPTSAV